MGSTGAWLNRCLWLTSLLLVLFIAFLGASMVQSYRRLTHPVPGAFALSPYASLSETLLPPVFTDYQSIAARNLFNATPSQPLPHSRRLSLWPNPCRRFRYLCSSWGP